MTTDYGCALGGPDHKVNWLITHLQPAMTISLCDEDFPLGVIPLLASELGVDPGRLYDSVKRFVDREQARAERDARTEAERDAKAAGTEPADPGHVRPEPTADQLAHPDDYDADGRPISADLT